MSVLAGTGRRPSRFLLVNACLGATVWLLWLTLGGLPALQAMSEHWPIALTMTLGSLVGGGTSEGGGAIAFPILTKVLAVPADTARLFTFAIQSVGMTAASISILVNRVAIEHRVLAWGVPSGVLGVVVSVLTVANWMSLRGIRVAFTVLLAALAVALVVQRLRGVPTRASRIPVWHERERLIVTVAGFVGGFLSGLAGVGENTVMFIILVLLFGVSEKVATPTTVILMTSVSIAAFGTHVWVVDSFHGPVVGYWLAAVPVVAVGAPLGAWLCTRMSPSAIRHVLVALIAAEVVSTVLLVPMSPATAIVSLAGLAVCLAGCLAFTTVARYRQSAEPGRPAAVPVG